MEKIKYWDEQLFLFLNSQHHNWLDPWMNLLTEKLTWIPLYAVFLFLIIKHFKNSSVWILAGIGLAILIADQTASGFMKPFFERLRPCHDPDLEGLVFNYGGCGGMYGFVSSHAANTFALAIYLNLVFREKLNGFAWLYLWAAVISFTRVYLGVHYPSDIIIGGLVGLLAGWLAWYIIGKVKKAYMQRLRQLEF